ncbi:MAG: hypothetical protein C0594_04170 [Marinilabiliales bacterium]|nr:MAG: hypothetical protein C0594_04170 [Marinilabiliales bacterium]
MNLYYKIVFGLFLFWFYIGSANTVFAEKDTVLSENNPDTLIRLAEDNLRKDINLAKTYALRAIKLSTTGRNDTVLARSYQCLGKVYRNFGNNDSAIELYNKAMPVFEDIKDDKGIAELYNSLAVAYLMNGDYEFSKQYFNQTMKAYKKQNDSLGLAKLFSNLGYLYRLEGQYDSALMVYQEANTIYSGLNDKEGLAKIFVNTGNLYYEWRNFPNAVSYYRNASSLYAELKDDKGLASAYSNIGQIYNEMGETEKSIKYFYRALKSFQKTGKVAELAMIYHNMGYAYGKKNQPDSAMWWFEKAIREKKARNDLPGLCYSYNGIGDIYIKLEDYDKAESYLKKSLAYADSTNNITMQINNYKSLSVLYRNKREFEQAFNFLEKRKEYEDSLFKIEKHNAIVEMQAKYETEKNERQLAENNLELAKREHKLNRQYYLILSALIGLVLFLILSLVLFRLYKQKRESNRLLSEKNEEIELQSEKLAISNQELEKRHNIILEKNQEISDSIQYASRIQSALLSSEAALKTSVKDYFIFFQPKDVVSGDFYWFLRKEEWLYITVADCTGHGVPGAFMSMLGISFLNEIVNRHDPESSSEILNMLRNFVIKSLKQTGQVGESRDGMDMTLAMFNTESREVIISGANNPAFLVLPVQNISTSPQIVEIFSDHNYMYEIKPDRMPVAHYRKMGNYTDYKLNLPLGSKLYLCSDGFQDQFGGQYGKKYKSARLKELFFKISHLEMSQQKQIIKREYQSWVSLYSEEYEQIDDITILGVTI